MTSVLIGAAIAVPVIAFAVWLILAYLSFLDRSGIADWILRR